MPITTKILATTVPPYDAKIVEAAEVLRRGGLVAFPTETVYGLGADAFNAVAVEHVFKAKGRPADNPVIVHISDISQLYDLGEDISSIAVTLAKQCWPGPLTLVVRHRQQLPAIVTAGLSTVAVRIPNHPVALALIRALGRGIVGPSANLSGKPSPTSAQHVYNDLHGLVDVILDAGPTEIGVESTVVDVTTSPPTILRLGGMTRETIARIIGLAVMTVDPERLQHSPGTRHRHYAPNARVELLGIGGGHRLDDLIGKARRDGKRVGCLLHSLAVKAQGNDIVVVSTKAGEYARILFDVMRTFDEQRMDIIIVESIPEAGIGEAVMDRLRRAAERR